MEKIYRLEDVWDGDWIEVLSEFDLNRTVCFNRKQVIAFNQEDDKHYFVYLPMLQSPNNVAVPVSYCTFEELTQLLLGE